VQRKITGEELFKWQIKGAQVFFASGVKKVLLKEYKDETSMTKPLSFLQIVKNMRVTSYSLKT